MIGTQIRNDKKKDKLLVKRRPYLSAKTGKEKFSSNWHLSGNQ